MSLLKNSTIVIVGIIISSLLAYVFHFVAGRMLGPEDYGVFGALMALLVLFALPTVALGSAITKFTSRFYSENKLGHIAVLRKKIQKDVLVFSAVMLVFFVIFSQFIANFLKINSNVPVIIVGISLVFTFILPVNRGILQGMKKFQVLSWNAIIEAFSRLVLLVVFLYSGFGVNGAILSYGLAYFIAFLWVFPYIKETKEGITPAEKTDIKPIYRFIFHVLLINIILQFILNLPSLFIKHFYTSEFTGYWTAAFNIARISLFITGAISLVMFPEIVGDKDNKNKKRVFYNATMLVFVTTSGMSFLFFIIPQFLIQTLYGTAYLGAVPILRWMGFAMIFFGLLQLRMDYFLAKLK